MSPASSQLPSRPWLLLHNLPAPHQGLEPLQAGWALPPAAATPAPQPLPLAWRCGRRELNCLAEAEG